MIYSVNNEPLVLTEDAADEFLESVGVELFEDEIGIDGTLYEGSYGEEILAEHGIFLYEDGIVLEGKQAEEYKARKAKEKADREDAEDAHKTRRYALTGSKGDTIRFGTPTGAKKTYNPFINKKDTFYRGNGNRNEYILIDKDDIDRGKKADSIVDNEQNKRYREYKKAYTRYDNFDKLSSAQRKNDNEHARNTKGIIAGRTANKTRNNNRDALESRYQKYSKDVDSAYDHLNRVKRNRFEALDAADRHIRRHPKQYKESTIFSDIEII